VRLADGSKVGRAWEARKLDGTVLALVTMESLDDECVHLFHSMDILVGRSEPTNL
jgi:hypothetical protein